MIRELVDRPAPFFALGDAYGARRTSAEFAGAPLLMVFFPFAFSPVCTREMGILQQITADSEAVTGIGVVAIATDSKYTLRAFAEAESLTVPLLSDFWPHGAVASRYGVFDERAGHAGRGTVVVDGDGLVRRAELGAPGAARDLFAWVETARRMATD